MPNGAYVDKGSREEFCRPMVPQRRPLCVLEAPQPQMLQGCGASRQMCHREGNDLTEMLIGGCDPKLRDADEHCPACAGS